MTDITFAVVTDAVRAAGTPADGRIVITSDTKSMYVGDGSTVGGNKIGPSAASIADNSVTLAKLVNTTQYKLLGRSTASTGAWEEVTTSANTYSLLACADYAAMRTALGVQPVDATLTALTSYNTDGILTQTAADTFVGRTITGTASQITLTNGNGVSGNPTISLPADVLIPTILTLPNTGLHILDTNASHDLIIACGSDLSTSDKTLTFTTGNFSRTVTINADTTISGTNTGDQTITLSSDVTGTGTGSFATTIATNAVTFAKFQQIATDFILGRSTAGTGNVETIACDAAGRAILNAGTAAGQRAIIEAAVSSVVSITTGSLTLTKAAHQGKKIVVSGTSAVTLVVNNSTDFDAQGECTIVNESSAVVTFTNTATIHRIGSKPLTLPQYGTATLARETAADTYLLTGEMA